VERSPAEHFESIQQQKRAAHLGMWLFLTSEVLLFGALFGVYSGYRVEYPADFARASAHNNVWLGTGNTLVLLTSSLFAAAAVHAARSGRRRAVVGFLVGTLLLAGTFLVFKTIEYTEHFHEGALPGRHYRFAELPTRGAGLFFTLYYLMTGLHGLHVVGGMAALTVATVRAVQGAYGPAHHTPLELIVLYWHLVDVIWIFLWPLLYLVG
jgi:cytochrome c oxidase subunit 3